MRLVLLLLLVQSASVAVAMDFDSYVFSKDKSVTRFDSKGSPNSVAPSNVPKWFAGENSYTFESIIGEDTRLAQNDSKYFPLRSVGKFDYDGCTGTLVGPRHVLTAAHCLYNSQSQTWNENFSFSPGEYNNGTLEQPFGTIAWTNAYVSRAFIDRDDSDYDYGMVILREPIGDRTGWLEIKAANELQVGLPINIIGYSGDKPKGTMMSSFCQIMKLMPRAIMHDCDTYGGNSGSAIMIPSTVSSAYSISIYGVHTAGVDEGSGGFNRGVRFSQDDVDQLLAWISTNNGAVVVGDDSQNSDRSKTNCPELPVRAPGSIFGLSSSTNCSSAPTSQPNATDIPTRADGSIFGLSSNN